MSAHRFIPIIVFVVLVAGLCVASAQETTFLRIQTQDVYERAMVANTGADIVSVDLETGSILVEVPAHRMKQVTELGFSMRVADTKDTMPTDYGPYHDFAEQTAELQDLNETFPDLTTLTSIGQTLGGRDLWCLKISDNASEDETNEGAIFIVAMHHAREILTPEVALYTARRLLESYGSDEMLTAFINDREIFIVPDINPDGSEFDHSGGSFKLWRKNRRPNDSWPDACSGVDLNRNYGYNWGGVGSTGFPCDLTYHGPEAFSELETQAVRDFVTAHENIKTLVTLHTFSELVLWPWSYQYGPLENEWDRAIFEQLGTYMADQNGYTPQQSSALYPTTGDTTDWAYGELGVYGFTMELSPKSQFAGGFYPNADIIDPACEANFNAMLVTIGMSRRPDLVLSTDLWKMNAEVAGDSVRVEWASILETNADGWEVLRGDYETGEVVKLTTHTIAAGQAEYQFVDETAETGKTYDYTVRFLSSVGLDQLFSTRVKIGPSGDDDQSDDDAGDDFASDDDDDGNAGGCGI